MNIIHTKEIVLYTILIILIAIAIDKTTFYSQYKYVVYTRTINIAGLRENMYTLQVFL